MDEEDRRLIDQGAPRTNQALVAGIVVVAYVANAAWVLPVLATLLYAGVVLGREFVPAYHLYFRLLQPRLGTVWMEDERAPRFAQTMGATGLLAGWACIAAGQGVVGWGLVLFLAAAALFSTATGHCLGCLTYRGLSKLRGVKAFRPATLDPAEIALPPLTGDATALVQFGHPLCSDCQVWERRLRESGRPSVFIDVRTRPDLARRYGVALLPTVYEVAGDGSVVRQMAP